MRLKLYRKNITALFSLTMSVLFLFTIMPAWADFAPGDCTGTDPVGFWGLEEEGTPAPATDDFDDASPSDEFGRCTGTGEHVCPTRTIADGGRVSYGQVFENGSDTGIDIDQYAGIDWGATDSFTIELWMKADKNASTLTEVLVGRTTGGAAVEWFLGYKRAGASSPGLATFYLQSNAGGDAVQLFSSSDVLDGEWHHLVAIRDGDTGFNKLYVDGALEAMSSATYTGTFADGSAILTIGYLNKASYFHATGTIDEVAIYNTMVPDHEITAHYINGMNTTGYCTALAPTIDANTPTMLESAALGFDYETPIYAGGNPVPDLTLDSSAPMGMTASEGSDGSWALNWTPSGTDLIGDNTITVSASSSAGADATGDYTVAVTDLCADAGAPLVSYWQLEEEGTPAPATDDFADSAPAGSNVGRCTGTGEHVCPTRTAADGGRIGFGQVFDNGSDTGIDIDRYAGIDWGATDSFTIELWMKATKSAATTTDVLVGRTTGGAAVEWFLGYKRAGASSPGLATFYLQSNAGGDAVQLFSASDVLDGEWHHLVAVRDGDTGFNKLYVDGMLEALSPATYTGTFADGSAILTIGYLNKGSYFHTTGIIDEVAIYDIALPGAMAQQHYSGGMPSRGYCNAAPTLTASGTLDFTENDGPTAINATLAITDTDDTNLAGATLTISANYQSGEDVLGFTDTANITATWDATAGQLTLSGSDTIANYLAALKAVTFDNTAADPSVLARTISYTVDDGYYVSTAATSTVSVAALPNNAPTITSTLPALTVVKGGTWTYDATAEDLDGDDLTWTLDPNPAGMTLSGTTGTAVTVSWTPDASMVTSGETTLTVSDGAAGASQSFTVTITEDDGDDDDGGGGGSSSSCFIDTLGIR